MKTWKSISSLENRYEICLETKEVRTVKNKKLLKLNKLNQYHSSWGLGVSGSKYKWGRSANSLMNETFPFWWINDLNEQEECKEVNGFPGYYITTKGRIYSTYSHSWIIPNYKPPYYYTVILYNEGVRCKQHIHTLVGRNFLPEYEDGMWVLHIDETLQYPEINYPDNLWLGNSKDNNVDRCKKGRSGGWMIGKVCDGVLQTGTLQ
jgi:hypothetical protein